MADRYWVGGTAAWDGTAGTKWATTSGGAGGASVPGGSDDVYFDAASGAAVVSVNLGNARSLICTGFTGSFTGSSQVAVYGGLTLSATMTHTNTLQYIFAATSGTWTVTTAGKTIGANINFGNGASTATWTLTDSVTVTNGSISVLNGTFNTGNFAVTAEGVNSSTTSVRAINLGSSTLTLNGSTAWNTTNISNLTFNAGTSTINVTSPSTPTFNGGGLTFYNVSYTGGGTSTATITGAACTFNNLSVTANATGTRGLNFAANHTINGSLTTVGTTATQRVQFGSSPAGTQRTLSVSTIGTLTDTNFKDIALTGAASPWTAPLGVVDLKNNTGITFDTTTLYWVGGAGNWANTAMWSTSSGGSSGAGVPGSTNNVVFDASSGAGAVAGNSTTNPSYCANFDCSLTSTNTTFSSVFLQCYGNFKLKSGVVNSFNGVDFLGTGTHTLDPNGATTVGAGGGFDIDGSGTFTLMNNWISGNAFSHSAGTFNTNGYSLSGNVFRSDGNITRTLNLGSSTLTFDSNPSYDFRGTNLTFNAGTSTINAGGQTFYAGTGLTFYNVNFTSNALDSVDIYGVSTHNNLTLTPKSTAGGKRYQFEGDQTINGIFTANGSSQNNRINIITQNLITQRTFTAASVSISEVSFYKIIGAGAASWTGTNIGNMGGNSGITFTTPKTVYWSLAAGGDMRTANGYATTSTGTPAVANAPLPQDTVIIDNAGLNSGATLIYSSAVFNPVPTLNFSSRTLPVTATVSAAPFICGNITLSAAVTLTSATVWYVTNNSTYTSAGVTNASRIFIHNGTFTIADSSTFTSSSSSDVYSGGTLTLNGPTTFSAGAVKNSGTVNLNSHILTSTVFELNNLGTAPTLNFGTGKIVVTGTGIVWNPTVTATITGTSDIIIATQSGAVTWSGQGLTYSKLTLGNGTNSTAQVTIVGNNTFGEISSNAFGGVLLLTAGTTQTVTNFTYGGYKDTIYNVAYAGLTSTTTTAANLAKSGGGTINANYLRVSYVNVTPTSTWNALNSLSVIGANTGWTFSGYLGNYGYLDAGNPIENKYVTKDYVMDYYPDLLPALQDGVVYGWGYNANGQLGDGTTTSRSSPVTFVGKISGWKRVVIADSNTLAQANDGSLWWMGANAGTSSPKSIPSGTDWRSIAIGYGNGTGSPFYAIKNDGTLWSWGTNYDGGLGGPGGASPNTVTGGGNNWKQVSSGHRFTMALKTDGTMWACGYNNFGQYGNGNTSAYSSFVSAAGGTTEWKTIAAGQWGTSAIKTDGTLWSCGYNTGFGSGQLGDGTTVNKSSFVSVAGGGNNWKEVKSNWGSVIALKTDGTLWSWGRGGALSPTSAPGGGTNWKSISVGGSISGEARFAAIKTDGTLWTWGRNVYGGLGDGTTSSRSSPAQTLLSGTSWKAISSGFHQSIGIVDSDI